MHEINIMIQGLLAGGLAVHIAHTLAAKGWQQEQRFEQKIADPNARALLKDAVRGFLAELRQEEPVMLPYAGRIGVPVSIAKGTIDAIEDTAPVDVQPVAKASIITTGTPAG